MRLPPLAAQPNARLLEENDMSVKAIRPGYHGEMKDTVDKFHGNQLLNVGWDRNLLYATPMCVPVPPGMPFSILIAQLFPAFFGQHPRFRDIEWSAVQWTRSGEPFVPVLEKSLLENGLEHKALLRFRTPELEGWLGSGADRP
jgi:phenol hydroxylase P4 protein